MQSFLSSIEHLVSSIAKFLSIISIIFPISQKKSF